MVESTANSTFAIPHQAEYEHTQWAPLGWLILGPPLIVLLVVGFLSGRGDVVLPLLTVGTLLMVIAFSFRSLRVVDEGEYLGVRFGPIPIFRKRVAYRDVVSAAVDRSTLIDGWGIHWVPGRGWTYNLWGFDCVRLELAGGKTLRIGTDDPHGLTRFVQQRIARSTC